MELNYFCKWTMEDINRAKTLKSLAGLRRRINKFSTFGDKNEIRLAKKRLIKQLIKKINELKNDKKAGNYFYRYELNKKLKNNLNFYKK